MKVVWGSFDPVLRFCRFLGPPLHVGGFVCTTALQRDDVIDDVTGTGAGGSAGGRARMLLLELTPSGDVTLDPAVRIALTARALR